MEVDIVWVIPARHSVLEMTLTPVMIVMMMMKLRIRDILDIRNILTRVLWALCCGQLCHLFLKTNCFCESLEKSPECHYSHGHHHIITSPDLCYVMMDIKSLS